MVCDSYRVGSAIGADMGFLLAVVEAPACQELEDGFQRGWFRLRGFEESEEQLADS
jgi:hypothetical protein